MPTAPPSSALAPNPKTKLLLPPTLMPNPPTALKNQTPTPSKTHTAQQHHHRTMDPTTPSKKIRALFLWAATEGAMEGDTVDKPAETRVVTVPAGMVGVL